MSENTEARLTSIRDRVKRFDRVPASSLHPSPHNWRTHPKEQADALRGLLAEIGFAGAELVRELPDGSLELIDGHLRAQQMGEQSVPVLVTDLDEDEAKLLLATFDPIGAMAVADTDKLDALLSEVRTDDAALAKMLDDLAHNSGLGSSEASNSSAGEDAIPEQYQILIEFDTEPDQASWLEKLTAEGLRCRSLIS